MADSILHGAEAAQGVSRRGYLSRRFPADGVYGYEFGVIQAELLALDGQRDGALQELRRAVDSGWTMYWGFFLGGDNFDTIRDEPAFQGIRQRLEAEMAKEHEALTAIPYLGEYDFRDVPGTRVPL